MTNKLYLFRLKNITLTHIREKNELDKRILNIIEKYEEEVDIEKIILHIIEETNLERKKIYELINEYQSNNLITEDFKIQKQTYNKFLNRNKKNSLKEIRNFLYDSKSRSIKELSNLDDDLIKIVNSKDLYDNTYENINYSFLYEIYNYILTKDNYSDENEKNELVDMAHTIRKIKNYIDRKKTKLLDTYLDNFEVIGPIEDAILYEKFFKNTLENNNNEELNLDFTKKGKLKDYLSKNLYLSIGLGNNEEKHHREYQTNIISNLISETKNSIFIISTESPTNGFEKPSIEFNKLKTNIHKRYISGLKNKNNTNIFEIVYDKEKKLFGERFSKGVHSKIIIIDDEIVIMGSGNWFTNKPSDFEDSLIILKCQNALSRYNPIYSRNSDYYKLIESQIDTINDLEDAFNFLRLINSDAILNSIAENVDPDLDCIIINKILCLLPSNLKNYRLLYDFLNDSSGFVQNCVKEIVSNNLNKLLTNEEKIKFEDVFRKYIEEDNL